MLIKIPRGWEIPENQATPEHAYLNRRQLLQAAGFLGVGGLLSGGTTGSPYPAKRNPEFTLDRPITADWAAEGYNNFYEFNQEDKEAVKNMVGNFHITPWTVEVVGLVNKPKKLTLTKLVHGPIEERLLPASLRRSLGHRHSLDRLPVLGAGQAGRTQARSEVRPVHLRLPAQGDAWPGEIHLVPMAVF